MGTTPQLAPKLVFGKLRSINRPLLGKGQLNAGAQGTQKRKLLPRPFNLGLTSLAQNKLKSMSFYLSGFFGLSGSDPEPPLGGVFPPPQAKKQPVKYPSSL